jgi:serine protease Do
MNTDLNPWARSEAGERRKCRLAVLLASALALPLLPLIAGNAAAAEVSAEGVPHPTGFAAIASRVKPAVIRVQVKMQEPDAEQPELPFPPGSPFWRFFHGSPEQQPTHRFGMALGSGFFISADGYAVTNNHVVEHSTDVQVTTDDGKTYGAKVIGTDPKTDLALIKVEGGGNFPFAKFADKIPEIGDWVLAVGNPYGLGGTVTAGIVSARGRDIGASPYDDFIQIDAPVNKGNSGGPSFDMDGAVIGVNTAIFSPSGGFIGIAFDIPADTAKLVIEQLKEKGYVRRGWIGVEVQRVTPEIAESMGLKQAEGALVAQPQPHSPAEEADIKAGDVITSVNGEEVKDSRDLAKKIAAIAPGTSVRVGLIRDGKDMTVTAKLGELPQGSARAEPPSGEDENGPAEEGRLGVTLAPARSVPGAGHEGVVVTGVDPNGRAAESGIQPGDVILEVGTKTVSKPRQVRDAVSQARSESKHAVLLRVRSGQNVHYVAIPVG